MTTIRQLHPGDEAALERFLLAHLDSSMFLLSNLRHAGLADNGTRYSGTYAAAFVDDAIVGVVAQYWNGNLICQAPVELEALWRLTAAISGRAVAGVIGPAVQVRAVCHALGVGPAQYKISGEEGLFALPLAELTVPAALQRGDVIGRHMTATDIEQLTRWRTAYNHETLGDPDDGEGRMQARQEIERAQAEGNTWVLEAAGQPVAMSSFNATTGEAVQIGGVYTPPALRGRGYGRAVVAASLQEAKAAGVQRAILFTDEDNIAAQTAYRSLGFQRVGDWGLVLLQEPVTVESNPP
jgi:RimJ/RimL family protein N-acetyltransferase